MFVHLCFLDESSFTGESITVSKNTDPVQVVSSISDKRNMVFGGTMVTNGGGYAVVVNTGMNSEIGKRGELGCICSVCVAVLYCVGCNVLVVIYCMQCSALYVGYEYIAE